MSSCQRTAFLALNYRRALRGRQSTCCLTDDSHVFIMPMIPATGNAAYAYKACVVLEYGIRLHHRDIGCAICAEQKAI